MNPVTLTLTNNKKYYDHKTIVYNEMRNHRENMRKVMTEIAWTTYQNGTMHDWTKQSFFEEYYKDTIEREYLPTKERDWYKIHTKYERHHLNNPPIDINLIDIIEIITDHIITGKTTKNHLINTNLLNINIETLIDAYWNTIELIDENTTIETENKTEVQ